MSTQATKQEIQQAVKEVYGAVARTRNVTEPSVGCCGPDTRPLSDYTVEELASVPKGAYLGEGSGVPVRYAGVKTGDVVIDLGAGAGMDSFLAANLAGPTGHVHGFDMTPDMLERARKNAADGGYRNITFQSADIERLPLGDSEADAAISNCVINLTPDKKAVYREIFRVLKPGGRLAVADIVLRGDAAAVQAFRSGSTPASWCACLSGALPQEDYLAAVGEAGFADVKVVSERPAQSQPGNGVFSAAITITARKPA